jgi:hypothetical protein
MAERSEAKSEKAKLRAKNIRIRNFLRRSFAPRFQLRYVKPFSAKIKVKII